MDNQKTIEQQQNAIAIKCFKIGAVVFVILVCATNLFVASFISVAFTALLIPILTLKAGLPLPHRRGRFAEDEIEARHKAELIDAPVISALSPYRSAGSGYQIYYHHHRVRFYH